MLATFDLPEEFPSMQPNGSTSVAVMLSQCYRAILYPFEESYKDNIRNNQQKAIMANRQGLQQNMGAANGQGMAQRPMNQMNQMNQQPMPNGGPMALGANRMGMNPAARNPNLNVNLAQGANGMQRFPMNQAPPMQRTGSGLMGSSDSLLPVGGLPEVLDQDIQGIKRKLDSNDLDNKRARARTGQLHATHLVRYSITLPFNT